MEAQLISAELPSMPTIGDPRTISYLKKNGYTGLTQDLVKDILYLEQLASTTQADLEDVAVIDALGPIERGNKCAINKLFFAEYCDRKKVIGELDSESWSRIERAVFDGNERRKARRVNEIESEIASVRERLRTHQVLLLGMVRRGRELHHQKANVEGLSTDTVIGEIKKILANQFYTFDKFAYSTAYFHTTKDVIIHYVNKAQNVDMRVDFGQLGIQLNVEKAQLQVVPYKSNVDYGHIHPFISSSGDICFGNRGDYVADLMMKGKYAEVFEILSALLSTYDPGAHPYVQLADFYKGIVSGTMGRGQDVGVAEEEEEEEEAVLVCSFCEGEHDVSDCENQCCDCERHIDDCECHH